MDGNSMIQVILKDGTKRRFNKIPKNGWSEFGFSESDIKFQKELTEDEVLKIPDTSSGKLVMRDKNSEELQAEQDAKQEDIDNKNNEILLQQKIRDMASAELVKDGTLTQAEVDKLGG
jgi:hypothetical protein